MPTILESTFMGDRALRIGDLEDLDGLIPEVTGWGHTTLTLKLTPTAKWLKAHEVQTPEVVTHKRLVEQVGETTRGRRDNYGRPLVNFFRIAALWHDYLAGEGKLTVNSFISPEDVALMMILLKVARAEHSFREDNLLDMMGYSDCLDDMNQQMIELGFAEGLDALHTMTITEMGQLGGKLTQR